DHGCEWQQRGPDVRWTELLRSPLREWNGTAPRDPLERLTGPGPMRLRPGAQRAGRPARHASQSPSTASPTKAAPMNAHSARPVMNEPGRTPMPWKKNVPPVSRPATACTPTRWRSTSAPRLGDGDVQNDGPADDDAETLDA